MIINEVNNNTNIESTSTIDLSSLKGASIFYILSMLDSDEADEKLQKLLDKEKEASSDDFISAVMDAISQINDPSRIEAFLDKILKKEGDYSNSKDSVKAFSKLKEIKTNLSDLNKSLKDLLAKAKKDAATVKVNQDYIDGLEKKMNSVGRLIPLVIAEFICQTFVLAPAIAEYNKDENSIVEIMGGKMGSLVTTPIRGLHTKASIAKQKVDQDESSLLKEFRSSLEAANSKYEG